MDLSFKLDNRAYSLKFNGSRVIQIVGDAATGKSLMCHDMREYSNIDKNFSDNVLVIDIEDEKLISVEKMRNYRFVVIDNADLLITPEIDDEIAQSQREAKPRFWIIIGRDERGTISGNSIGSLVRKEVGGKYQFSMDYNKKI